MTLKLLSCLGILLYSTSLYTRTYEATLLEPKSKEAQLLFLAEDHKVIPDSRYDKVLQYLFNIPKKTEYINTVIRALQKAEKQGDPFHVCIEKACPLTRKNTKAETKCLLTDLAWRAKEELSTTVIEDIETRKKTGIPRYAWRSPFLQALSWNGDEELRKELVGYIGKTLFELTFQDLFDELRAMMDTAHEARALCKAEPKLHEYLGDAINNCTMFLNAFEDGFRNCGFDKSHTIVSVPQPKRHRLDVDLAQVTDALFDFHVLKRIIELQREAKKSGLTKKIMIIAGGAHIDHLLYWLRVTNKYNELGQIPDSDPTSNSAIPLDRLEWILRLCLADYALKEALDHQEKDINALANIIDMACTALLNILIAFAL